MNLRPLFLISLVGSLGMVALGFSSRLQAQDIDSAGSCQAGRGHRVAAAAQQLGVSTAELRTALGLPETPIRPDFTAAAQQLGTTETELKAALEAARSQPGRPDLAAVAAQFDTTESELRTALGLPEPGTRSRPDLGAAAAELGITQAELEEALRSARSLGVAP